MDWKQELLAEARKMLGYAYAPYSGFCVGAAILGADGRVYTGCNVENASYGASICAERTAAVKAVSQGVKQFRAVAIVSGRVRQGTDGDALAPAEGEDLARETFPCGICRQFLSEFMDPDGVILTEGSGGAVRAYTLGELLPRAFSQNMVLKN